MYTGMQTVQVLGFAIPNSDSSLCRVTNKGSAVYRQAMFSIQCLMSQTLQESVGRKIKERVEGHLQSQNML